MSVSPLTQIASSVPVATPAAFHLAFHLKKIEGGARNASVQPKLCRNYCNFEIISGQNPEPSLAPIMADPEDVDAFLYGEDDDEDDTAPETSAHSHPAIPPQRPSPGPHTRRGLRWW